MSPEAERGPRVLIVDDDIDTLEVLSEELGSEGISVVGWATTGEAAIELAEELSPTVVLLDAQLPGSEGFRTARRLHRSVRPPAVVFLTAYEEPLPGGAQEAGGYAYLVKGCSAGLMRDVITAAAAARPPPFSANGHPRPSRLWEGGRRRVRSLVRKEQASKRNPLPVARPGGQARLMKW